MRQHLPWSGLLLVLFALPSQSAGAQQAPVYRLEVQVDHRKRPGPVRGQGAPGRQGRRGPGGGARHRYPGRPDRRRRTDRRRGARGRAPGLCVRQPAGLQRRRDGRPGDPRHLHDAGGVIGAATPVDGQGTRASEKIVSAMRGEFRALAEARGLDPQSGRGHGRRDRSRSPASRRPASCSP